MVSKTLGSPTNGYDPNTRPQNTRQLKRFIFLVTEGLTELEYFRELNTYHLVKNNVQLKPIIKDALDETDSDRHHMIAFARDYYLESKGLISFHRKISNVLNDFFKTNKNQLKEKLGKKYRDILIEFRESLFNNDSYHIYANENLIVDNHDNSRILSEKIAQACSMKFDLPYSYENTDEFYRTTYKSELDQIYLVFDRDLDSRYGRGVNDFDTLIDKITNLGMHAIVTTPAFELWLLLHFDKCFIPPGYTGKTLEEIENCLSNYDEYMEYNRKRFIGKRFEKYYKDNI